MSTAAYAYYYLGNSIQLIPVGIFGTSIAKAALPTLARQSDDTEKFRRSLWNSFSQIIFLVIPVATILIVLRIPVVRLIYGTQLFDWESTVQTGLVVSAFAVGVVFQATASLLARAFYALQNTKTPVIVSILSMTLIIILNFVFIKGFNLPVWGLAAAYSFGSALQASLLFVLIRTKLGGESFARLLVPGFKSLMSALVSGSVMFVLLKVFDRSVWVKRLSFVTNIEAIKNLPFESFVLDTRYTINLLILTASVSIIGMIVYLVVSILLRSREVWVFFGLLKRVFVKRKVTPIPAKEPETVSPTQADVAD
jgi:peptidoglycan biosynthesis protein MviN/MurJ (putative lipid II flippase)